MNRRRDRLLRPLLLLPLLASLACVSRASRDRANEAAELRVEQDDLPAQAPDSKGTLDPGRALATEHGLYRIRVQSELDPIEINMIHSWVLHVETADGKPVKKAIIHVEGGMPAHRHGLPTVPRVTKYLGDGKYRLEGVKFQMPGWWVMKFRISASRGRDSVSLGFQLE